ncbi:hypothetical protein [Pseudaminobacter soli (ex Li et al. 2025)]|uniref:Uncharacterized protein n=1 Tax=Pseudaminobacter soli (ex Li et al. 2025) TaxID=1295366 RepID=A0A2P7SBM8_9HYPH|nr:hypothetical protein [Mesorhizobium soli]PSJ59886.1 hypothetical protein C7I85_16255 [Mesorhizobium soli]
MAESLHPAAVDHLPFFITAPGQTDVLLVVMVIFILVIIFLVGVLYFRLHALPEHMAHGASKGQLQLVAVLALIALFTHNHLFWIAALLLALIEFPDFSSPMNSIARSLRRIAGQGAPPPEPVPTEAQGTPTETKETPATAHPAQTEPQKPHAVQTEPQLSPVELDPAPGDELSERRG